MNDGEVRWALQRTHYRKLADEDSTHTAEEKREVGEERGEEDDERKDRKNLLKEKE